MHGDTKRGTEIVEKPKPGVRTERPSMYRVLLLNDDYTTMQFVVEILETIFEKSPAEAHRIMMNVHTRGRGECGVYTFDIAETKIARVHEMAQSAGFPLRADLEEA